MSRNKNFIIGSILLGALVVAGALLPERDKLYGFFVREAKDVSPMVVLNPGYPVDRHGIPTAVYGTDACPDGDTLAGASGGSSNGCIVVRLGKVPVRFIDRDHVAQDYWTVKLVEGALVTTWSDGSVVKPWEFKEKAHS